MTKSYFILRVIFVNRMPGKARKCSLCHQAKSGAREGSSPRRHIDYWLFQPGPIEPLKFKVNRTKHKIQDS